MPSVDTGAGDADCERAPKARAGVFVAVTHMRMDALPADELFRNSFEQQELRHWIDQTLRVNAVPAAPGISYV